MDREALGESVTDFAPYLSERVSILNESDKAQLRRGPRPASEGWYSDPLGLRDRVRRWNGDQWTGQTRQVRGVDSDQVVQESVQQTHTSPPPTDVLGESVTDFAPYLPEKVSILNESEKAQLRRGPRPASEGWYSDPLVHSGRARRWNGDQWTGQTRQVRGVESDPVVQESDPVVQESVQVTDYVTDLQFKDRPKFRDSDRSKISRIIDDLLLDNEQAWRVYRIGKMSPLTEALVLTSARIITLNSYDGGQMVYSGYYDEIERLEVTLLKRVRVRAKNGLETKLGNSDFLPVDDLRASFAYGQASGNAAQVREQAGHTKPASESVVVTKSGAATSPLLSDAVFVGSRPNNKAMRIIAEHSTADEQPWLVIGSPGSGALVAFSDRVMIVKVGGMVAFMAGSLGGGRVTTFMLSEITGIEYNSGFMSGVLEILTASYQGTANKDYWRGTSKPRNADSNDPYTLSNTLPLIKEYYQEATPHLNRLRKMIAESKIPVVHVQAAAVAPQPAPSGSDITTRLAQLVQMKEAGHLTPEEFEDAKRQVLGNK